MLDYFRDNAGQILDGLLFGLGVLAIYLGAILSGALIRSLAGAGSTGILFASRYARGWVDHLRGDDRDIVNVTLNMISHGRLRFDTLVADRKVYLVWPNAYRAQMIRSAARRTSDDNPVLLFPERPRHPSTWSGRLRRRLGERIHRLLASVSIVRNGRKRRVRLVREDDYKATYGPLISLVSEKCTNEHAIDLALGRPMAEYRFVIALTFEKLSNRRARHLRAMVMWEDQLRNLPAACPLVDKEEHRTRYRTLQTIAAQYREHPDRFGIVHIWRPKRAAAEAGVPELLREADAAE